MIIERGRDILHNCNKKRRLDAPAMVAGIQRDLMFSCIRARSLGPMSLGSANLGRLALELRFQTLHLVFEAQL